ncbi:hypothetical protein [Halomontanus rarus]|uniref:hypothetical protein n=1 Tax=Halomontanus rarus TaxID=3034020 RepID=UPI0023E864DB|nr:hypothetical protein [Halovivax sp. TS33]
MPLDIYVERCGDQLSVGSRLEEEAVSTSRREADGEPNDSVFRVRLFRVDVEIGEVPVSKRYEVAECTKIRIEVSEIAVLMYFELEVNRLADGYLSRSEFDIVTIDLGLTGRLRTLLVLRRTRRQ